jgi:glycosyltransferase involved in cell wall biosynthesis
MSSPLLSSYQVDPPLSVGVALCCFNGESYIEQQIASILKQTRPVDLIVISDDGSADSTVEYAKALLNTQDIPWRLIQEGRLGIAQNFARAVEACETDIIFLSDQDDIWLPQKIEELLRVFEQDANALLACSDATLVDESLIDLGRNQFDMVRMTARLRAILQGPDSFPTLLRRNVVTGATVAIRRALLVDALPFNDDWLHDEWLAIIAAARKGLRIIPIPLVLYRQHSRNQCGMRPERLTTQLSQAARRSATSDDEKRFAGLQLRLEERLSHCDKERTRYLLQIQACRVFAQWRMTLPHSRRMRIPAITRNWITGAYDRYSDGLRSAIKDLLAVRN